MKEIYTKPIAEIDEFKSTDVITTSTGTGGIENIPGGWDDDGGIENGNDWD